MSETYREFIETVRAKSDILQLVSDYVKLERRGGKYWGCCPFHQEKTASFTVSPDKGFFYCFGCQTGGDAISFVQKIENLQFKEALSSIAGKYGIPEPEEHKSPFRKEQDQKSKDVYKLNGLAKDYFVACLNKTVFGKKVFAYLRGRGIDEKTIEAFSLGAALQGNDRLYQALLKKGFSAELMVDARLVIKRENGGIYDFFHSRLMIPIKDARGNVVGFGGRILEQGNPKYLNTAESMLFNKKRLLYGLDVALAAIRQTGVAIVVEGYLDAIALHSAGFTNAVASLGTAFSEEQARLLARAAKEVVFCYDSDIAGQKAAFAAISIARRENISVKAFIVPEGKDPDEFIKKFGKEKFAQLLQSAKDGFLFQKNYIVKQKDFSTLAGKLEIIANILPILAEQKTDIEIKNSVSVLASELVIEEAAIVAELNKYLLKNDKHGVNKIIFTSTPMKYENNSLLENSEGQLLQAILLNDDLFDEVEKQIEQIGFSNSLLQEIYVTVQKQRQEKFTREELFAALSDEARAKLVQILSVENENLDLTRVVADCLKQIKKAALEKKYNYYRNMATEYERAGDERFLEYLAKSKEIREEIRNLY